MPKLPVTRSTSTAKASAYEERARGEKQRPKERTGSGDRREAGRRGEREHETP